MPFDKVETQIDFPAQERAILDFWQRTQAFERLWERQREHNLPRWSFLDGPITANNPMGVHHAWGRAYKDVYQRYFAMTGHQLRYQNGFDCQGLWVEVEVEKELKLKSKQDIESLVPGDKFASIDRFVSLCKQRVDKFARIQSDQSIRLGMWMDWDRTDADWAKPPDQRRSYFTMSEENNYTIWSFLKKCHGRGLVYKAYDSMPWCPRCAVGISQMEMHEGYQLVAHRAVFVRFPLRGKPQENLLIWTTTPWTLSSNVAAAVNPNLTYVKVKHNDQIYYVAKGALTANRLEEDFKRGNWVEGVPKLKPLAQHLKEKGGYEVLGELGGAEMIGWEYDGPFDELAAQNQPFGFPAQIAKVFKEQNWAAAVSAKQAHRVVPWAEVGETEGTGIVHIAPGCGKEDFELAKDLQKFAAFKAKYGLESPGPWAFPHLRKRSEMATEAELLEAGRESARQSSDPEAFLKGWSQGLKEAQALFQKTDLRSMVIDKPEGLPGIGPLNEDGVFLDGFGPLCGMAAIDAATTDFILDNLKSKGLLVAVEKYPHNYPHCWRCKTELLFRLVDEWYIGMSWRDEIMRICHDITWIPEDGLKRELDWLKNMGDWMISKKRYWGLALPIWVDEKTGDFEVIGSQKELQERAVEGWGQFAGHSPHRPWIDKVKIKNPKTGNLMSRIPDVGNPWLDAGIVPFSTVKYNSDPKYWEQWFPADFITESFPGQFRNWFYALLAMGTMMTWPKPRAPFKALFGYALVRDQHGEEMHKSAGNAISFDGAADTGYTIKTKDGKEQKCPPMSVDLMRWMYCRHNPSNNINFGPGPAEELRNKFTMKLWNVYAFFCNLARPDGFDPATPQVAIEKRPDIDRWILSELQLLIRTARKEFERFNVMGFCLKAEEFVDDKLSNWYVRRNRRRFWRSQQGQDKLAAYQTLHTVLVTLTKLFAPVIPFVTETMYRNLVSGQSSVVRGQGATDESVHHCSFPEVDPKLIDADLSADMEALLRLVSLGSAARNTVKIKVRQPLAELKVQPADERDRRAVERFADQIGEELNIKKVTLHGAEKGRLLQTEIKLNPKVAGPKFGPRLAEVRSCLDAYDPAKVVERLAMQQKPLELDCPNGLVTLEPADVQFGNTAPPGWAGLFDRGTSLIIDARITEPLKLEGLAREVVRCVQNLRKDSGLQLEDRISLHLKSEAAPLAAAIEKHRDYIMAETLTTSWSTQPLGAGAAALDTKIEGHPLHVEVRKV